MKDSDSMFTLASRKHEDNPQSIEDILQAGAVYYCGKDKKEYVYLGTTDGVDFLPPLALFALEGTDSAIPMIGVPVDSADLEAMSECLFEKQTDYGDGIARPLFTYVGNKVPSSAKVRPVSGWASL